MPRPQIDESTLKIAQQVRIRDTMVYCFRAGSTFLTLRVSPRQCAADEGDWRVEARPGGEDAGQVVDWGATRAEALRAVSRSWTSNALSLGLPRFDWDLVTRALVDVRAL